MLFLNWYRHVSFSCRQNVPLVILRGRPFDPERGGLAVRTDYLFSSRTRPEKIQGGAVVRGFSRGAGHGLIFCRLLAYIITYMYLVAEMF